MNATSETPTTKGAENGVANDNVEINDVRNFNLNGKVKTLEDSSFDDGYNTHTTTQECSIMYYE